MEQTTGAVATMTPETEALANSLRHLDQAMLHVIWGLTDGTLPEAEQIAFGAVLADVGQAIQRHARNEPCWPIPAQQSGCS
jgi:hypothetical protein